MLNEIKEKKKHPKEMSALVPDVDDIFSVEKALTDNAISFDEL